MRPHHRCKKVSFSSGKGGVGKTLSCVNVACALADMGHRVLIIDGDFGLSNVDVVFGIRPRFHLNDVLSGRANMSEVAEVSPQGVHVISSGSGVFQLNSLDENKRAFLAKVASDFSQRFDFILMDTGAGIDDSVLFINECCDINVIVTTPEPHALTDAYALIKTLPRDEEHRCLQVLVNMCSDSLEGTQVFERLSDVVSEFQNRKIQSIGNVVRDTRIQSLIMRSGWSTHSAFSTVAGQCWLEAARAIASMAENTLHDQERYSEVSYWDRLLSMRAYGGQACVL